MHHELPYTLWGSEVNLTLPSLPPDSKMREMDEDSGDPIHGYFQTPQGKLHYRQYLPDNGGANGGDGIKAVCIWQHGIHSHSGATVLMLMAVLLLLLVILAVTPLAQIRIHTPTWDSFLVNSNRIKSPFTHSTCSAMDSRKEKDSTFPMGIIPSIEMD